MSNLQEQNNIPLPEEEERPHKCPFCEYRAKTPSLLSRHINYHHKNITNQTPRHLLSVLNTQSTVPDMLVAVAKYVEGATTFDERLPEDVIAYLRREDAKTQLILRVIAIHKIQRAMELGDYIKTLEDEFKGKINDAAFRKDATPNTYLGLIERMVTLQEKELMFLKEIVQLGEVNLNDVVEKLVGAFGTSQLGSKKVKGSVKALQFLDIELPDDPNERENMRGILSQLLGEADDELGGETEPVETSVEESAGTDSGEDQEDGKS